MDTGLASHSQKESHSFLACWIYVSLPPPPAPARAVLGIEPRAFCILWQIVFSLVL